MNNAYSLETISMQERQIAALLQCRFGDGLVYLPRNWPKHLYTIAKRLGFIDNEGYMTRKGRALLVRNCYS